MSGCVNCITSLSNKQWSLVQTNITVIAGEELNYRRKVFYDELRGRDKGQNWPSLEVDSDSVIGRMRLKSGIAFVDLPSEAQWEYACRAGTTTDFNNGTNDNSEFWQLGSGKVIGRARPNAWGLYDFHTGAWEWCGDYFKQTLSDAVDPMIGRDAWNYHPIRTNASSNYRYFDRGDVTSNGVAAECGARFVIFLEHNQE